MWTWCGKLSPEQNCRIFGVSFKHFAAGEGRGRGRSLPRAALPTPAPLGPTAAASPSTGTFCKLWVGCVTYLFLLLPSWISEAIKVKHQHLYSQVWALRKAFHWRKSFMLFILFHSSGILFLYLAVEFLKRRSPPLLQTCKMPQISTLPHTTIYFTLNVFSALLCLNWSMSHATFVCCLLFAICKQTWNHPRSFRGLMWGLLIDGVDREICTQRRGLL